jgi:PAS domain S-box-containing protein
MNAMIKQRIMSIFFASVVFGSMIGCAAESNNSSFGAASIKTYRDIPGVTSEEINAIEALKSSRQSFSYGARLTAETLIPSDNGHAGFAFMLCELLSDLFGVSFVLELKTWDRLVVDLSSGTIDFAVDLTAPNKLSRIYFMSHPIAERPLAAFTHEGSTAIKTETDLNGLRIGFLEGTNIAQEIHDMYPELAFETVFVINALDAAEKLASGEIDVFVDFAMINHFFAGNVSIRSTEILPFVYSPVSMITMNPELEPFISVLDKYIETGGIDRLQNLYDKSNLEYSRYHFRMSLTEKERAYLDDLFAKDGKVPVALEADNYPMSFFNKEEKKFQGIVQDILAEISDLTGIEFYAATDKNTSWLTILEKLNSGEVSFVSELLYSEERKDNYLWSNRYASSHYALLSKTEYPNLKIYQVSRATVGIGKDSAYDEMYNYWFPKNSNAKYYDSQDDALNALENGEVDLVMASENVLLTMRNYREKPGYKANILFNMPLGESYFGFNKKEEVLCSIFCKAQSYINEAAIEKDWTSRVYDYSRRMANERLNNSFRSIAGLIVALIILVTLLIANIKTRELYKNQMTTLSTMYKSLPDLVYSKDLNGAYTSCNRSFEIKWGISESEIIGKTAMELDPDQAQRIYNIDQWVIQNKQEIKMEAWYTSHGHPEKRLFEVVKTPLLKNGKVVGLLGIDRDITEHRKALQSARDASMAKSNFLARMSHEIRTPMNAIMGMTELALRENELGAAHRHIRTVKQAGTHLLSIINDVLDFSKIEVGKLEIVQGEYLFSSLINDVISIIRMRLVDAQVRFAVNVDSKIPNSLKGDETRVRQILLNILSNAVKYTEKGFVSLTVSCESIDENAVGLTMEVMDSGKGIKQEDLKLLFGDYAQIDMEKNKGIEGTGLGLAITWNINKAMGGDITVDSEYGKGSVFTITLPQEINSGEVLASVNNPENVNVIVYERRELYANSIICAVDNLGVRCTLVASDLELYENMANEEYNFVFISYTLLGKNRKTIRKFGSNAKIVVLTEFGESIPDEKLSILAMPVYCLSIANILNGKAESFNFNETNEDIARFTAPDAKVLIVDDITTNLKVAEGLLSPYKIQLDLCKGGKEAIEAMIFKHYDLVFMDHKMPEMDGIEATMYIRKMGDENPYYKDVPIIALTANAVLGVKEDFLNSGFNDFLSKPIDTIRLNNILEKWIPKEKQKKAANEDFRITDAIAHNTSEGINIEGVDVSRGVFLSGGTVESFLETLAIFCKDGSEKINEIKASIENVNLDIYTIHIHALKSASANIGASELAEAAGILEMAGERKDLSYIKSHTPVFLKDLEALLRQINDALAMYRESRNEDKHALDRELFVHMLEILKKALETLDARVMNESIEALQEITHTSYTGSNASVDVNDISEKILIGEYDEAAESVEELLKGINDGTH